MAVMRQDKPVLAFTAVAMVVALTLLLAAGAWGAFTNYDITNYRAFQRKIAWIPNSGKVPITYTYTGASSNISAAVMDDAGFVVAWTQIHASASTGTYTDTLADVPCSRSNHPYNICLKSETVGDTVRGTNQWIVGVGVACAGQSFVLAYETGTSAAQMTQVDSFSIQVNGIGGSFTTWRPTVNNWQNLSLSDTVTSLVPSMVNTINRLTDSAVFICGFAEGGTALYGNSTSYWGYKSTDTATSKYAKFVARAIPHKPECIVWYQGQSDVGVATLTQYKDRQDSLFKWWRDTLGYNVRIIVMGMHNQWAGTTDTSGMQIAYAKVLSKNDSINLLCFDYDLPLSGSHPTKLSQDTVGIRIGTRIADLILGNPIRGYNGPILMVDSATARGTVKLKFSLFGGATSLVLPTNDSAFHFKNNRISPVTIKSWSTADSTVTCVLADAALFDSNYIRYGYGIKIYGDMVLRDNNKLPAELMKDFLGAKISQAEIASTDIDRYFVGGSPHMDSAWSLTSGGARGASKPDNTMIAILDGGGTTAFTFLNGTFDCRALYLKAAYTGAFTEGKFGFRCRDQYYDIHGGNTNIRGMLTIGGDMTFNATGTVTLGSDTGSYLNFDNDATYDMDKASQQWDTIKVAKNKKVIITGAGAVNGCKGVMLFDTATIYLNSSAASFVLYSKKLNPLSCTGGNIEGNVVGNAGAFYIWHNLTSGTPTQNIPLLRSKVAIDLRVNKFYAGGYVTTNCMGFNMPRAQLTLSQTATYGRSRINVFDSLNVASLYTGSSNTNDSLEVRFCNANGTITQWINTGYTAGRSLVYFDSSDLKIATLMTLHANQMTDTAGKGKVYFNYTNTMTTANHPMPNIFVNDTHTIGVVKVSGNLRAKSLNFVDGRFKPNTSTDSLLIADSIVFSGADNCTLNTYTSLSQLKIYNAVSPVFLATAIPLRFDTLNLFCELLSGWKAIPPVTIKYLRILDNSRVQKVTMLGTGGIIAINTATKTTIDTLQGFGGTAGALDTIRSGTPGAQCTLDLAGTQKITVSYAAIKDVYLAAGDTIVVSDGTSLNLGNNSGNVVFPATSTTHKPPYGYGYKRYRY